MIKQWIQFINYVVQTFFFSIMNLCIDRYHVVDSTISLCPVLFPLMYCAHHLEVIQHSYLLICSPVVPGERSLPRDPNVEIVYFWIQATLLLRAYQRRLQLQQPRISVGIFNVMVFRCLLYHMPIFCTVNPPLKLLFHPKNKRVSVS